MENYLKIIILSVFFVPHFVNYNYVFAENNNLFEMGVDDEIRVFLNFGDNSTRDQHRYRYQLSENPERNTRSKVNVLSRIFKMHVDHLRSGLEEVKL